MGIFKRNPLLPGRWLRGVLAWVFASLCAALVAASLATLYLIAREGLLHPPFSRAEWWVFTNMFWPFALAGFALIALFGAPLALGFVWLNRRLGWPRPAGDMAFGALTGLVAVWLVIAVFSRLAAFGA